MKKSPKAHWFALLAITALGFGMLLIAAGPGAASHRGRVLSDAEMAAVFGDAPAPGTDPCRKDSNCLTQYTLGLNDCEYCNVNDAHSVCCDLGTKTDCNPGGGTGACVNALRRTGAKVGGVGTCNTCDATFADDGKCSLKNAITSTKDCP